MAIYYHYVDNVSGATGNGGTGPADAHYNFQQAFDGISGGGYDNANDLIFVYVKDTGVTYSEEGVSVSSLDDYEMNIVGTNSSFVEDGSKPAISNSSDYFINSTFGGRMYWRNFNFNTTYSNGIMNWTNSSQVNFINCDFEGNSVALYATGTSNTQNIIGTHVSCTYKNFTNSCFSGGSNRRNPNYVYCYFKNADPWRHGCGVGEHWLVNCVLEDSHVQDSNYDEKHIVNTLFYGSSTSAAQLYFGDRSTSAGYHVVVNNAFVDAPGYAIASSSTKDTETYLMWKNFFHGAVSGTFNMSNNFDPSLYFGITASSGDPTFVDEASGGTAGFQPTNTSTMSKVSIFNNDIGPIRSQDPVASQLSVATSDFDTSLTLNSTITFEGSGKTWRLASKTGIPVFRRA